MRTLVLGIPLPHVTFDNYSFLSAPSLFDYGRAIVETSALSLAELLRLRRLEAERLLARGGIMACFAYPDVSHEGIRELPGWRRYDWLTGSGGFSYRHHPPA